jgi:hypothetical protein
MAKIVHKYGDAELGDVVTLKSGSPKLTIVKFVPSESPPIPDGIQNAGWEESDKKLAAQVIWVAENGTLGQATLPISALVFEGRDDKRGPKSDPISA